MFSMDDSFDFDDEEFAKVAEDLESQTTAPPAKRRSFEIGSSLDVSGLTSKENWRPSAGVQLIRENDTAPEKVGTCGTKSRPEPGPGLCVQNSERRPLGRTGTNHVSHPPVTAPPPCTVGMGHTSTPPTGAPGHIYKHKNSELFTGLDDLDDLDLDDSATWAPGSGVSLVNQCVSETGGESRRVPETNVNTLRQSVMSTHHVNALRRCEIPSTYGGNQLRAPVNLSMPSMKPGQPHVSTTLIHRQVLSSEQLSRQDLSTHQQSRQGGQSTPVLTSSRVQPSESGSIWGEETEQLSRVSSGEQGQSASLHLHTTQRRSEHRQSEHRVSDQRLSEHRAQTHRDISTPDRTPARGSNGGAAARGLVEMSPVPGSSLLSLSPDLAQRQDCSTSTPRTVHHSMRQDNSTHTPSTTRQDSTPSSVTASSKSTRSSSNKRKRKFPGPAGVLPRLKPGMNLDLLKPVTPATPKPKSPEKTAVREADVDVPCSQTGEDAFSDAPWRLMLQELEPRAQPLLEAFSLAAVIKKAALRQLPRGKVPVAAVIVDEVHLHVSDASAILRDPTTRIKATIHRQLVRDGGVWLVPGAVLVLRQVGVFSPSLRSHYLNITPSNVLRVYARLVPGGDVNIHRLAEFTDEDLVMPASPPPPPLLHPGSTPRTTGNTLQPLRGAPYTRGAGTTPLSHHAGNTTRNNIYSGPAFRPGSTPQRGPGRVPGGGSTPQGGPGTGVMPGSRTNAHTAQTAINSHPSTPSTPVMAAQPRTFNFRASPSVHSPLVSGRGMQGSRGPSTPATSSAVEPTSSSHLQQHRAEPQDMWGDDQLDDLMTGIEDEMFADF